MDRKKQNQASSLQLRQNQRENKIKKSKLAYWLNYSKAAIPQSPPSVHYCQISVMLDSGCFNQLHASGISSVAHHNPRIHAMFVYLNMQELFIDKIHFFNFLSMSDKPRLHQLKLSLLLVVHSTNLPDCLNVFISTEKYHQGWGNTLF